MLRFPQFTLLALALLSPTLKTALAADEPAKRPNIIYLMADDQRYDTIRANGGDIMETPNLDKLAAEGVSFDQAFCTTAICMTSRTSVFTGQYASRHKNWNFGHSFTNRYFPFGRA